MWPLACVTRRLECLMRLLGSVFSQACTSSIETERETVIRPLRQRDSDLVFVMAGSLPFTDVSTVRAHMKTILKELAEPCDGPYTAFTESSFLDKIEKHGEVQGVAVNLLWCELGRWAIADQVVPEEDLDKCEAAFFDTSKALVLQPDNTHTGFSTPRVTYAIVHSKTLMFTKGCLRKLSNDTQIYAFLRVFSRWIKMSQSALKETRGIILKMCYDVLLHWPMTIIFKEMATDLEKCIFLYQVQLLENLKKDAESDGSGGWKLIKLLAHGKTLAMQLSLDSSADGILAVFKDISFAKMSGIEQKDLLKGGKQVASMLLFHERAIASNSCPLLDRAQASRL